MRFTKFGLTDIDRDRATPGFTLFTPLIQTTTYLLNLDGEVVHEWTLNAQPGNYAHLLPNGNLFVATKTDAGPVHLNAKGGRLQELDWDGNLVWDYTDDTQHHDFRRLPNGNTIYLAWELLPKEAAARVQGGREGSEDAAGIWGDYIREVDPEGNTVWEWHAHEELEIENYPNCPICPRAEWSHPNSLWVLDNGDIMISFRHNHLIAVIDRSSKKFKWEWRDRGLGHQHDFQALDNGNYMVFVNGAHSPRRHSAVLEFDPATKETVWEYRGKPGYTFDSPFISGAQRLWSGNTLICEGQWGRIFEVTPEGDVVWEYISPHFVRDEPEVRESGTNNVFRAYRYQAHGPEIQGRV
jgi:hypothetical protein